MILSFGGWDAPPPSPSPCGGDNFHHFRRSCCAAHHANGLHMFCILQAAAFERIKPACLAPFPRDQYAMVHVQPFGSYANGLSLAASDIDVVITGVTYPDDGCGGTPALDCFHILFTKDLSKSSTHRLCLVLFASLLVFRSVNF